MKDPGRMTDVKLRSSEIKVLHLLADAYNEYCALLHRTPDDDVDFRTAIHTAQRIVALRVARRADPQVWVVRQETMDDTE